MIRLLFFILFWCTTTLFGQNSGVVVCRGKVNAEMTELEGIYVINLNTENATITDSKGFFTINAKVGDSLLLSSVQFKSVNKIITTQDLSSLFFVNMYPIMNELKEVVVKRPTVSAESLGIIPYGQKKYTPAERKLRTAEQFKWYSPLLIPLGGMSVDGLLNSISGRTAMLKKELEVEKKEGYLVQLENLFDNNHYVNTLHIPSDYVKGFMYFVVENPKFTRVLKTKNRTSIEFLMSELATQYIQIITPQNTK
jgi:hypothetical protein